MSAGESGWHLESVIAGLLVGGSLGLSTQACAPRCPPAAPATQGAPAAKPGTPAPQSPASLTPSATRVPSGSATTGTGFPLCGVLSEAGYGQEGQLTFVVPSSLGDSPVRRFNLESAVNHPAPLSVYAGWWFCITAGQLEREPDSEGQEYGLIRVEEFSIDQSTGERGQE